MTKRKPKSKEPKREDGLVPLTIHERARQTMRLAEQFGYNYVWQRAAVEQELRAIAAEKRARELESALRDLWEWQRNVQAVVPDELCERIQALVPGIVTGHEPRSCPESSLVAWGQHLLDSKKERT